MKIKIGTFMFVFANVNIKSPQKSSNSNKNTPPKIGIESLTFSSKKKIMISLLKTETNSESRSGIKPIKRSFSGVFSRSVKKRINFFNESSFLDVKKYLDNSLKLNLKSSDDDSRNCVICLTKMSSRFATIPVCSHAFCVGCLEEWIKVTNKCPICTREFFSIQIFQAKCLVEERKVKPKSQVYKEMSTSDDEIIRNAENDCYVCKSSNNENFLLICDYCLKKCCHTACLEPPIDFVPQNEWYCDFCVTNFKLRQKNPIANIFLSDKNRKMKRSNSSVGVSVRGK